jgi:hypothetical protein
MRKTILLALFAVSAASQAQVTAITGPFPTFPFLQENFDLIPAGSYASQPIWSAPAFGNVYALNAPFLVDIMPPPGWQPPAFNPPNTCVGNGTDIGITVGPIAMRRFGGWFRNSPNSAGVAPSFAKVVFVNSAGVAIGSVGIPLTNTWTWFGWKVNPKFSSVEIYGLPGGVEIDDIEVKPN